MTCRAMRPSVRWSKVAILRAARVGATKPGRWAIRKPSRSVWWAACCATRKPSADDGGVADQRQVEPGLVVRLGVGSQVAAARSRP